MRLLRHTGHIDTGHNGFHVSLKSTEDRLFSDDDEPLEDADDAETQRTQIESGSPTNQKSRTSPVSANPRKHGSAAAWSQKTQRSKKSHFLLSSDEDSEAEEPPPRKKRKVTSLKKQRVSSKRQKKSVSNEIIQFGFIVCTFSASCTWNWFEGGG